MDTADGTHSVTDHACKEQKKGINNMDDSRRTKILHFWDNADNLYVEDGLTGGFIRKITPAGKVPTVFNPK